MDDIRRRRVDSFCGTGYPSVPFVVERNEWMRGRDKECCWMIGEERYRCFNYTVYLQSMQLDSKERLSKARSSLDDFDPLNDMEDYPANLVMSLPVSQQSHQGYIENRQKAYSKISNKFRGNTSKGIKSKPGSSDDSSRAHNSKVLANESRTIIAWDPTVKESHTLKSAYSSSDTVSKTEVSTSSLNVQSENTVTETIADFITNKQITSEDSSGQAVQVEQSSSSGEKSTPMQTSSPNRITEIKNSNISASISNGSDHINYTSSVTDSGSSHVFSPVKLSDQWCCLRGFLSGSRDQVQSLSTCFEKADAFSKLFPHWTRSCDKNFVVCCMAVSEFMTERYGQSDGSNWTYFSGGAIMQQVSFEMDKTTKVQDVWSDHSGGNNRNNSKLIKAGNSKNNHEHRVKSRPDNEETKQTDNMRKSHKQKVQKKTKPVSGKNIQQGSKGEHSHLLNKIVTNNFDIHLWDSVEGKDKSKEEDEEDGGDNDEDDNTNDEGDNTDDDKA
ncbi:hypothetical protein CHS0354_018831 [Potamilus streckersoni]|uniref:Uncharacterized protein n=1 Tax=Potamilus streckersoni TaxID=2493646 RepID=A0AAE0VUL2_9BIVA|nr:hypothetical protein CHS0354_018831 [Potamilus streckersoni]